MYMGGESMQITQGRLAAKIHALISRLHPSFMQETQ